MSSLKAGILAGLVIILVVSLALVFGPAIMRSTNVLAGWADEPVQLKPVMDEQESQSKQPLPEVWEHYRKFVQYPADEFQNVLSSRLRHRQFDELESFANEIRTMKSTMKGGKWILWMFYISIEEPAAGSGVDEEGWKTHFTLLEEWKAKYPKSITARVAHARSMVNYAWKARTTKFAAAVTEAQWNLFFERLESARKTLTDATTEADGQCPVWYSTMLTIANGEGWGRYDYMKTFDEAVEFEPTYPTYYHQLAVHFLPQWFGKQGEWASVLAEVTQKQGTEEADAMLQMTFATVVIENYDYEDIVPEIQRYWPRIKRGFHTREQLYGASSGDLNDFTHMAYIAGDREETRAMFLRIKDRLDPGFWGKDGKTLAKAQAWANEPLQPGRD